VNHARRQNPHPNPRATPDELGQYAKAYECISSRRDLRDNEKALLYALIDLSKKEGFAYSSWQKLAVRLGKNKKNVKRAFQRLEGRFPGLFLIRRFRRMPSHVVVNLDALDGQPHLEFPGVEQADYIVSGGGASAPSAGGATEGASAPTLGAPAPPPLGAHAPPNQSMGIKLMISGPGGAPSGPGPGTFQPSLFGSTVAWLDPRAAIAQATAQRPLTQVYVDFWRAGRIRFVLIGGRRFITNASADEQNLYLDVWAAGERNSTTERLVIGTANLFAGVVRFGAPG
jgi:hypothetical protein